MAYENCIDLNDVELDKFIYRFTSVERFIQMLQEKRNTLVKPKLWEDKFENQLMSEPFIVEGKLCYFAPKDEVFGQCWTFHLNEYLLRDQ